MKEISLHILDIAENSIGAGAKEIQISITENLEDDILKISIKDDGKGMDAQTAANVIDPFVTSRTTRKVGLGIPLLNAAAESCRGGLEISSTPGKGTIVHVDFQRSHIDRMPLGDISGTILNLVVTHPEIHWLFEYQYQSDNGRKTTYLFDDAPIKEVLEDIPLSDPSVLAYLRETLQTGIENINDGKK